MNPKITFSEDEIRPNLLTKKQAIFMANDLASLLSRNSEFVDVSCPACHGRDHKNAFVKNTLQYKRCNDCETIFMSPRPTEEILEWFYKKSENYEFWKRAIFPASDKIRKEKIFKPRVEKVLEICSNFNVGEGVLMDVGAAFGTFCSLISEYKVFKKVIGLEPTPSLAEHCRNMGIETIEETIEQVKLGSGALDVITSFEVIEHLFCPKSFIEICHGLLKKGGIFIVTCPNSSGFDIAMLQEKSIAVDHEHLNYFNTLSLGALFEEVGFKVLDILTPGVLDAELVRKKVISGEFSMNNWFFEKILINEWDKYGAIFQEFLIKNKLSSNMWLVGQKL